MTKIEWTKGNDGTPGKSWNVVTGCSPVSEGCAHCYARRMAHRLAGRYGYPEAPHEFDVTLHPWRLEEPLQWRKPLRIFVCSMSDLFHDTVPPFFICEVWQIMRECPQHTFIILTKRARRMHEIVTKYLADGGEFAPLPKVWGMVTAENQQRADERIPWLLKTPFAVRGVSYEPALAEVDLGQYLMCQQVRTNEPVAIDSLGQPHYGARLRPRLDWLVAGAETGPGARPADPDWLRSARDQCAAAGVRFFYKRGSDKSRLLDGRLHEEWPEVSNG